MSSRLLGWPLIIGCFGLIFGLILGSAAASMWDFMLLSGPKGPAAGAVVGFVIGFVME